MQGSYDSATCYLRAYSGQELQTVGRELLEHHELVCEYRRLYRLIGA